MSAAINLQSVTNLTSQELQEYLKTHHEREFALIDVRQAEEYMEGHIPGARLMSLNELPAYAEELRQLAGRRLVFYCRSGGRSSRASAWAAQALGLPHVFNLVGGFLGWNGDSLVDFPRLAPFETNGSLESLLRTALQLEKGTERFYEHLASQFEAGPVGDAVKRLLAAEAAHAEAVYDQLADLTPAEPRDFAAAYAALPDTILENGLPLPQVVDQARKLAGYGELALLELALEIELTAYDLYKNLATAASTSDARQRFDDLAQQEKGHAELILRTLGGMARSSSANAS